MKNSIKTLSIGLALAGLLGFAGAASAQDNPPATDQQMAPSGQPSEAAPSAPAAETPAPAAETPAPAAASGRPAAPATTLAALAKEGFEARATAFVPTEAATRQVGASTPDAIVLTLQRGSTVAVCYYTLSAYVNDELPTISSCVVHK